MLVKLLESRHPNYNAGQLQRQRALYCGGEEWRALTSHWLPKHPDEMPDLYQARLARALYENHVGPIIGTLAAAVFSEAPQVGDVEGDWLATFLANVDGKGTALGPWCTERLVDALIQGKAFVWVNLPARDGTPPETRAEEEARGLLDAFLVSIPAEQVIDWETDAQGRLRWLMIRDVVQERPSVDAPRSRVHRWTAIDRTTIRRWTWTATKTQADPLETDLATAQPPIEHGFGDLPIVCLSLTENLHAGGKLHDPAIAHLRGRNDLSWALHRGAHPLLVIKTQWQDGKPILGPGYYLAISEEGDAKYAEPSGASFALLAEDVVQLREALYRLVQQMAIGADSSATRSKMSAESKSADWKAMDIVLTALSGATRTFLGEVVRMVAKARKVEASPTITGLDGWSEEDIDVWLAAAAMSTDAHRYSPTFTKAVAKRQAERLLQGSDPKVLDTIRKEIDAAEVDPAPYLPLPLSGRVPPGEAP